MFHAKSISKKKKKSNFVKRKKKGGGREKSYRRHQILRCGLSAVSGHPAARCLEKRKAEKKLPRHIFPLIDIYPRLVYTDEEIKISVMCLWCRELGLRREKCCCVQKTEQIWSGLLSDWVGGGGEGRRCSQSPSIVLCSSFVQWKQSEYYCEEYGLCLDNPAIKV